MSTSFKLGVLLAFLLSILSPASAWSRSTTYRVKAGQSIQNVIKTAKSGDTIIVEAGTYAEQLFITTSGLTVIGKDAVIVPPANLVTNTCTSLAGPKSAADGPPSQAGICIAGSGIVFQDLSEFNGEHRLVRSVGQYIKDTSVSGFTVKFFALDIAIVGAKDTCVNNNKVDSGFAYGILTVGSKGSNIEHNIVTTDPAISPFYFIGICMNDTSNVEVAWNDLSGTFIGLCVQTNNANIHDNKVHDVCVGAFVDPGVKGARLRDNTFSGKIGPGCPAIPNLSSGVTISGAENTLVKNNKFSGLKNQGQAAGVAIVDNKDSVSGAVTAVAKGNVVEKNRFEDNDVDIYVLTTGEGNVVKDNKCSTSNPAGLCK